MSPLLFLLLNACYIIVNGSVQTSPPDWNTAFDSSLYKNVLDSEECERQLLYIRNNATSIRTQFMDASWRTPRGILTGNTRDLGNYFQCLNIHEKAVDMSIEGKYCGISVPLNFGGLLSNGRYKDLDIPEISRHSPWHQLHWEELQNKATFFSEEMKDKLQRFEILRHSVLAENGMTSLESNHRTGAEGGNALNFNLAVCIPKVCTSREALDFFTNNLTGTIGFTESYCRLPNDKHWVPVDTVAVTLLSVIGLITIISTAYDIRHTIILKRDPKNANKIYQSFSVFTNTRNFFVFPSGPNVVTCLDGVRSFAMLWVLVGHVFQIQLGFTLQNMLDVYDFMTSFSGVWIMGAPITVDTFFLLSGILIVYTTASKLSRSALLKNLHLFYLNRVLRMFPVLAFTILMSVSFLQRLGDGPVFAPIEAWVNTCRATWWSTLLYVQNYVNPEAMCMGHTWYLAIDMQLYFLAPIVLYWVLGNSKKSSWIALISALLAILIASSIYNFINDFPSVLISKRVLTDSERYMQKYYINTLTRASPFFVGMIVGYLLHIYRGKQVRMHLVSVLCLWVIAFSATTTALINIYWTIQADFDNQIIDNLLNSYMRPLWAAGVGWMIFACHKGYGGPINWILSLYVFKILGRLSYAMYLLHYPLMYLNISSRISLIYFTTHFSMYKFMSEFWITFIAAFLVTILIDFPFTNLIKLALEGKRQRKPNTEEPTKESLEQNFTKNDRDISKV